MSVRVTFRLFLGPLVVALLAGIQLSRYGVLTAVAGAYFTFAVAEAAVVLWGGAISYGSHAGAWRLAAGRAVDFAKTVSPADRRRVRS